jgi:hypothetical protein
LTTKRKPYPQRNSRKAKSKRCRERRKSKVSEGITT